MSRCLRPFIRPIVGELIHTCGSHRRGMIVPIGGPTSLFLSEQLVCPPVHCSDGNKITIKEWVVWMSYFSRPWKALKGTVERSNVNPAERALHFPHHSKSILCQCWQHIGGPMESNLSLLFRSHDVACKPKQLVSVSWYLSTSYLTLKSY